MESAWRRQNVWSERCGRNPDPLSDRSPDTGRDRTRTIPASPPTPRQIVRLWHLVRVKIGIKMVEARPALFAAYSRDGAIYQCCGRRLAWLRADLDQARAMDNTDAIKSLEAMAPHRGLTFAPKHGERLGNAHDAGRRPGEQNERGSAVKSVAGLCRFRSKNLVAAMAFSTEPLTKEAAAFDTRAFGSRFPIRCSSLGRG